MVGGEEKSSTILLNNKWLSGYDATYIGIIYGNIILTIATQYRIFVNTIDALLYVFRQSNHLRIYIRDCRLMFSI